MQTDLRFQVANDEKQREIDNNAFPAFNALKQKNLKFLQQFYPELFHQVSLRKFGEHTIFINRLSQLNIVELSTGEALYPIDSEYTQREHAEHAEIFCYKPGKAITPSENLIQKDHVIYGVAGKSVSESSSTLVCLGLGLGVAVEEMVLKTTYKNIIVLEPSWDFFLASLFSVDWLKINRVLNEKGGMLAFDIGEESSATESISTIFSQLSLSQADFYLHLHYPQYDALKGALTRGYMGSQLEDFVAEKSANYQQIFHESPLFSHAVQTEFNVSSENESEAGQKLKETFRRNLNSFERFFPDIAMAMKNYRPQSWFLTVNQQGSYNLFNRERKTFWYNKLGNKDVESSFEKFETAPVETVPSTNIKGGKLHHYTFYQYAEKISEVMNRFGKTREVAPKEIPSLILISLGLGRAQEKILEKHDVEYLYVIEPNIDFFFWSLHCINWSEILENFNTSSKHLNFSIGDDGTHFIDDMKQSMSKLNGFFLFNSFLFIERKLKSLSPYIFDFREELTNLVALSEHFHYAHYAFSHTYINFSSGHTSANVGRLDGSVQKDIPVFVVGNGPSLDRDMGYLKSIQDDVVIVSCGTALRSLWKNGITPDFHAELEQNKCTYSIISQIPDKDYLKKIYYLAPTWTHPETASLFKHHYAVFISFSGSMQFSSILKEKVSIDPYLPFLPTPTVSNFAVSSLLKLGLKNLVLLGIDLGFKDIQHHHSKDSLYYNKSGKEKFSYESSMGQKLMVRGNFEVFVYTKPEFQISARNIGKAILESGSESVRNCSDGAKIEGAFPVELSSIDIPYQKSKKDFLNDVLEKAFSLGLTQDLFSELDKLYQKEDIKSRFKTIVNQFNEIDGSFSSVKAVIESQKSLLYNSYHDGYPLLFGLFVSTFNFAHSSLLKVALSQKDESDQYAIVKEVRDLLVEMLNLCFDEYQADPLKLENTVGTELVEAS